MKIKLSILAVTLFIANTYAKDEWALPGLPSQTKEYFLDQNEKKTTGGASVESHGYFFTGKPYDSELSGFIFKYRNYDPEMNRWTSMDPSGFWDGLNNQRYASCPTSSFDVAGLLDWETLQATGVIDSEDHPGGISWTYEIYTIKTNDGNHTIHMWKNLEPFLDPGGTANCHGYVFANGDYWIQPYWVSDIIAGDGYQLITGADKTGARVALWPDAIDADHSAIVDQVVDGTVTLVTGLKGIRTIPSTTAPSAQWGNTGVQYYE